MMRALAKTMQIGVGACVPQWMYCNMGRIAATWGECRAERYGYGADWGGCCANWAGCTPNMGLQRNMRRIAATLKVYLVTSRGDPLSTPSTSLHVVSTVVPSNGNTRHSCTRTADKCAKIDVHHGPKANNCSQIQHANIRNEQMMQMIENCSAAFECACLELLGAGKKMEATKIQIPTINNPKNSFATSNHFQTIRLQIPIRIGAFPIGIGASPIRIGAFAFGKQGAMDLHVPNGDPNRVDFNWGFWHDAMV